MSNFKDFIKRNTLPANQPITAGKFEISLPKTFGFCGGVVSALKKLENVILQNNEMNIFLLGEIIHNSTVNDYFSNCGVNIIPEDKLETVFDVAGYADIVVIPAFGIPLKLEYKLRKFFHNIVDTTCVNVQSVWNFVEKYKYENYSILLHGKPGHPEVQATISRCMADNAIAVIPDKERAEIFANYFINGFPKLPEYGEVEIDGIHWILNKGYSLEKFALANQTTMMFDETKEIESVIKPLVESLNSGSFVSCNTICKATSQRQKAASELCKQSFDLGIVIGGYESSNTAHLYLLIKENIPAIYIKNPMSFSENNVVTFNPTTKKEEIFEVDKLLQSVKKIALFAGASCPFSDIEDVIEILSKI